MSFISIEFNFLRNFPFVIQFQVKVFQKAYFCSFYLLVDTLEFFSAE